MILLPALKSRNECCAARKAGILRYYTQHWPALVLSLQQSYILKACAMSPDPPACYDNLPSRLDLQDAMVYGAWGPPPRFTPGQFYHYVDPQPIQQQHYPKTCQPTTRYPSCQ
jgi:hypothetical protein